VRRETAAVGQHGKSAKNTSHAGRRARQLQAQQKRRDARRRLLIRVGAPVLVVLAVIATLVVVRINQQPAPAVTGAPSGPASATVTHAIADVPAATFDTVGAGTLTAAPSAITGPALTTADGQPRVVYIGAEYCPYCAAERWAVATALSRFGSFTDLGQTTSASADVYPNTATLSFHGATYTSDLLAFTGVETTTNVPTASGYAPLDTPSAADQALDTQYNPQGSIPFIDLGNKYMIAGASFDPAVLQGLSQDEISAKLADPLSPVAQAVDGAANVITAAVCALTGQQPAAVCGSAGVVAGAAKLPS
jgi:hypothetical protein